MSLIKQLSPLIKPELEAAAEGKRRRHYHVVQMPSYLFWTFVVIYTCTVTLQVANDVMRRMQPETDATSKCREVASGTIGWKTRSGILCVRPVHFIEGGA